MTPEEWAEVFRAGWDDSNITRNEPAGDAVAKALRAMELKVQEIAGRRSSP
jgi:hypothetical protein